MSIADIVTWAYSVMEHPLVVFLSIPLIIIISIILKRQFILVKEEPRVVDEKRRARRAIFWFRSFIVILLCIALASPFVQEERTLDGDPFIQLLVDNSSSMDLFVDNSAEIASKLEKRMNTEVSQIGSGTNSNIGDGLLNNLEPQSSILLLSDGNVNSGADLGDVALFASKLNVTINAIQLVEKETDVNVAVLGPSKTMENADNTFQVIVNRVGKVGAIPVKVTIDGEVIYEQSTSESIIEFTRRLEKGTHKIVASVSSNDFFPDNNVFYKTIKVVPQPNVLLLSESASPMETFLKQLYLVDVRPSLPTSIVDYYAVVTNDLPASKLNSVSDVLNDFVADGNGLVAIGGENAYDKGGYEGSQFEGLLPVLVGTPEKKEGDLVVSIVIDISGSTSAAFGDGKAVDVEKSLAVSAYRDLKIDTLLSVIAFNTQAYLVSAPSLVYEKQGLESTIARLKDGGGTNIAAGLMKAIEVMRNSPGSKNIILVSDGKSYNSVAAIEAARLAANLGIKIYSVGVGASTDEQFMMDVADITNGIYFRATEESKLRVLFGSGEENEQDGGTLDLVIMNPNHFITENVHPEVSIYGFNQVSPKSAGRLLAATSNGHPILTVWRLGLGRVAAWSSDDGSGWSGEVLSAKNSALISRTMNWAIGDPERKSQSYVDAKDARLDESVEVTVKSSSPPSGDVTFYKVDEDLYTASIVPSQVGFQEVAGAVFGVSYEREFQTSGLNPDLEKIVRSTGGKVFAASDIDGMVKHAETRAKRTINSRFYLRWPFILVAIVLFLLEIFIRRLIRRE